MSFRFYTTHHETMLAVIYEASKVNPNTQAPNKDVLLYRMMFLIVMRQAIGF